MKTVADFTKKELDEISAAMRAKALVDIKKYEREISRLREELILAQAHYDYACRIYEAAVRATEGGAR